MDKVESRSERVNELADEFVERFRRGERPSISQYVERFPEAEREIREVLSALVHVERLAPSSRDVFSQKVGSEFPQLEQLGDFRIVREVGRGGMGIVYEAEQLSLGRRVALKVLPTQALLDTNYKKRFVREAKAAARLHHTNIVPVFGVGEDGGLQYYAMQFIHGLGLDEVLAELRRLRRPLEAPPGEGSGRGPEDVPHAASAEDVANSLLTGCFQKTLIQPAEFDDEASTALRGASPIKEESASLQDIKVAGQTSSFTLSDSLRLPGHSTDGKRSSNSAFHQSVARIGIQAAQALQYAHSQGILHRDIKPSNLLLDTHGTLWVTDFGLAKHLPSAEGDGVEQAPDITGTGDIVGTLRYLPPEAFSGKSDARSDIFSLGLTLYELLALKPAYDETDRRKLVKQVTHEAPESLYKMDISIPKDLITIVHKAIERDPADRFQTAEELAKDLDRFLNDEPIRARRISIPARFGRWCKRNKTIAGLVGMIFVLLLGAAVTSVIASASYRQVATAKGQALDDLEREKQHTEEALTNEVSARQSEKIRLAELELMRGRGLCERGFVAEGLHWMARGLATAESAGVSAKPLEEAIRHNLDGWQNRLCRLRQSFNVEQMNPTTTSQQSYALADDGKTLLMGVSREGVFPYDLARGQLIQRRLDLNEKPFSTILLHPDGELLIVKFSKKVEPGKWIGQVRIWNRLTGEDIATISHPESSIKAVALDADHDRLATADENGEIRLWDIRTGKRLAPTIKFPINTARHVPAILLAFSPDGKRLATAGKLTTQLWDPETGQPLGEPLEHPAGNFVKHVEFSPDGRRAVTVTNQPYLWDVESCRQIAALGHAESLTTWKIAFSPDGKILAAGNSKDRFAYLWAAKDGEPLGERLSHDSNVNQIRFSPNGKWILTASGTSAQLWTVPSEDQPVSGEVGQPVKHDGSIRILEFLPDGKSFVTATGKAARIWDLPTGDQLIKPGTNQSTVVKVEFWPDDQSLAIAGGGGHGGGTVAVYHLPGGGFRNGTPYPALDAAFAASGDGYVVASALLPDTRNAGPGGFYLFPRGVHYQRMRQQPVPPNVFYKKIFYKATSGLPYDVALSPDGTRLVTVLQRYDAPLHEVSLWEVSFAPPQAKLLSAQTHRSAVRLEFHPAGDYYITYAPEEGIIERWDAESGHALGTLIQVEDWIKCVVFSPDGKLLATGSKTHATVRDAQTGEPRFRPIPHRGSVTAIAFSPDGKLITGSTDLGNRVWDPATGLQLGPTLYHEGEIWSLAVSRNGKLIASGSKDKTARVWRVPQRMPGSAEEIRLRVLVDTGLELTKDGSLRVLDAEAWQKKQDQLKRRPVRTNPGNKEKKSPDVPES